VLAKAPPPSWSWNRLSIDRRLDIIGVVLALTGLLTLLSLFSSTNGAVTGWWTQAVKSIAGWGSFVLPVTLILVGIWLVLRNVERLPMLSAERLTGLVLLYLNILAWMHMSLQLFGPAERHGGRAGGCGRRVHRRVFRSDHYRRAGPGRRGGHLLGLAADRHRPDPRYFDL
jgi:S-DNA-T family DNA segregation ATPase FtsK/SpoIIIE